MAGSSLVAAPCPAHHHEVHFGAATRGARRASLKSTASVVAGPHHRPPAAHHPARPAPLTKDPPCDRAAILDTIPSSGIVGHQLRGRQLGYRIPGKTWTEVASLHRVDQIRFGATNSPQLACLYLPAAPNRRVACTGSVSPGRHGGARNRRRLEFMLPDGTSAADSSQQQSFAGCRRQGIRRFAFRHGGWLNQVSRLRTAKAHWPLRDPVACFASLPGDLGLGGQISPRSVGQCRRNTTRYCWNTIVRHPVALPVVMYPVAPLSCPSWFRCRPGRVGAPFGDDCRFPPRGGSLALAMWGRGAMQTSFDYGSQRGWVFILRQLSAVASGDQRAPSREEDAHSQPASHKPRGDYHGCAARRHYPEPADASLHAVGRPFMERQRHLAAGRAMRPGRRGRHAAERLSLMPAK